MVELNRYHGVVPVHPHGNCYAVNDFYLDEKTQELSLQVSANNLYTPGFFFKSVSVLNYNNSRNTVP